MIIDKERMEEIADLIGVVCDDIRDLLIDKNKSYGNSVENPLKIFSSADWEERINVRIDDKLSRLSRGSEYQGDDTEFDLIGYLILKRVIRQKRSLEKKEKE